MPATYRASGFRPVTADDATEAARIFATRAAQRRYGRRGYCRNLRLDSWSEDGTHHNFEAFIGKAVPGNPSTTAGHDIWLQVVRGTDP